MPLFEYTVLDGKGKRKKGFLDASSPQSARETLKKDGFYIVSLDSLRLIQVHQPVPPFRVSGVSTDPTWPP